MIPALFKPLQLSRIPFYSSNFLSKRMSQTTADEVYDKAEGYWASVASDVDGMLGGFQRLHTPDVNESKKFVHQLKSNGYLKGNDRALDCGCGIGRTTKHLLLPMFKTVDMVDFTKQFIDDSVKYLGSVNARVGNKFVEGLQTFTPGDKLYDLIWVQWVSGHLTDEDFVEFIERCKKGITATGCIIFKENIASTETKVFDETDHSWTRPLKELYSLFEQANVNVVSDKKQKGFPKGMYEVRMLALKPKMQVNNGSD